MYRLPVSRFNAAVVPRYLEIVVSTHVFAVIAISFSEFWNLDPRAKMRVVITVMLV